MVAPLVTAWLPAPIRVPIAALSAQTNVPSLSTGLFTSAQVERGRAAYLRDCSRCHRTDLSGDQGLTLKGETFQTLGPSLKGETFFANWGNGNLNRLFLKIRDAMPPSFQAIVDDKTKVDILTHLLHENGFPSGSEELTLDTERFERIQILRSGLENVALPNFAVVRLVGCLAPGPGNRWSLTHASAPILTTDGASTSSDLKEAAARPLGQDLFLLLNAARFNPGANKGFKMEAKGLLYREPGENRITLRSLQKVAESCAG
jgi:hypothetical protein